MVRMIQQKTLFRVSLTIVAIVMSLSLFGKEYSRDFKGECKVSSSDLIDIKVKYADDVAIKTTGDKKMSFTVKMQVEADSEYEGDIREMLDLFDYELEKRGSTVELDFTSSYSMSQNSSFFSDTKTTITIGDKTFKFSGKVKISKSIEVFMPVANNLKLDAKYSEIDLGRLESDLDADLKYSKLYANDMNSLKLEAKYSTVDAGDIKSGSDIDIAYSTFTAINIQSLKLDQSYSKFTMAAGEDAVISEQKHSKFRAATIEDIDVVSSSYSEVDLGSAVDILLREDRHGDLNIGSADSFISQGGAYSTFNIGNLKKALNISTEHSTIRVGQLGSDIAQVKIKNRYSTISLGTQSIDNFDLYIKEGKYSTVKSGDNLTKKSDGYYKKRSGEGSVVELDITAPYSTINIKE